MLQKQGNAQELGQLVKNVRPYLGSLSKAKAARLVRTLVDLFLDMDSAIGLEVDLCKDRATTLIQGPLNTIYFQF